MNSFRHSWPPSSRTASASSSSHIIGELERTCDYLAILCQGQVQLAGEIDALLAAHHILVGPPVDAEALRRDPSVVQVSHAPHQTTLMVCGNGRAPDARWERHPARLEDVALAYLSRRPSAATTLPLPAAMAAEAPGR